jgi:PAS domain-containing protein
VLESIARTVRDEHGNVVRLCGTCHDVTEQRRAERALAESEARFRHGFDDAPIGMAIVDVSFERPAIAQTNKALTYLLGYTPAELQWRPLQDFVEREDWPLL